MTKALITVQNVSKVYRSKNVLGQKQETVALNNFSLQLFKGETLGLVGESGSGKSTLGKLILGFEKATSGNITFAHANVQKQVIFQDPYAALNPKMSALNIVREAIWQEDKQTAIQKAKLMLEKVGIVGDDVYKLPRQFSGGQRQRIGIARAIVSNPDFIVCDEPTSALDVSIQTQILSLLNTLKKELDLSYLFISHDLSVVKHISDRIAVMYQGQLVELAPSQQLFNNPQHDYTKKLLAAELPLDPKAARLRLETATRSQTITLANTFEWQEVAPNHFVRVEANR